MKEERSKLFSSLLFPILNEVEWDPKSSGSRSGHVGAVCGRPARSALTLSHSFVHFAYFFGYTERRGYALTVISPPYSPPPSAVVGSPLLLRLCTATPPRCVILPPSAVVGSPPRPSAGACPRGVLAFTAPDSARSLLDKGTLQVGAQACKTGAEGAPPASIKFCPEVGSVPGETAREQLIFFVQNFPFIKFTHSTNLLMHKYFVQVFV